MKVTRTKLFSDFANFWKDLLLLVLGIYLALWMENTVQDWENDQRQKDYLYRLSLDLDTDEQQLKYTQDLITKKESKLKELVSELVARDPANKEQTETLAFSIASTVSEYYFFVPQDFTYLSMRESGDFKLIRDEDLKSELIELYARYQFLETLQANYIQGLDDGFIPLWVKSADMLTQKLVDKEILDNPMYRNMAVFAWNESSQRNRYIESLLKKLESLKKRVKASSEE